ncbi:hypothetical protein [Nitratifractor salsuginis]|uniref:Uncharacterized protein n=1 Tax=Nitratifractor salsuginis (strain DSM 16511 / JCM 12458 / E9I37-1) TaxID=749222 RepID=E6WY45_NITSE|nr:hypothetical protein [Nitratifractor salsuginis]ADV46419.1 hypothetical protein Nitsa_1166 [Nitratifractor salsuginis DSM 16511]
MANKYIEIKADGSVVVSQGILDEYPEINAYIDNGKLIVENVWHEEFLRTIGPGVFWCEAQEFESYGVLFRDGNRAVVDSVDGLVVRYMSHNPSDLALEGPIASENMERLISPYGGIAIDIRGELEKYVSGGLSLDSLATIAAGKIRSGKFDSVLDGNAVKSAIAENIQVVPKSEISKFLNSAIDTTEILSGFSSMVGGERFSITGYGNDGYIHIDVESAGKIQLDSDDTPKDVSAIERYLIDNHFSFSGGMGAILNPVPLGVIRGMSDGGIHTLLGKHIQNGDILHRIVVTSKAGATMDGSLDNPAFDAEMPYVDLNYDAGVTPIETVAEMIVQFFRAYGEARVLRINGGAAVYKPDTIAANDSTPENLTVLGNVRFIMGAFALALQSGAPLQLSSLSLVGDLYIPEKIAGGITHLYVNDSRGQYQFDYSILPDNIEISGGGWDISPGGTLTISSPEGAAILKNGSIMSRVSNIHIPSPSTGDGAYLWNIDDPSIPVSINGIEEVGPLPDTENARLTEIQYARYCISTGKTSFNCLSSEVALAIDSTDGLTIAHQRDDNTEALFLVGAFKKAYDGTDVSAGIIGSGIQGWRTALRDVSVRGARLLGPGPESNPSPIAADMLREGLLSDGDVTCPHAIRAEDKAIIKDILNALATAYINNIRWGGYGGGSQIPEDKSKNPTNILREIYDKIFSDEGRIEAFTRGETIDYTSHDGYVSLHISRNGILQDPAALAFGKLIVDGDNISLTYDDPHDFKASNGIIRARMWDTGRADGGFSYAADTVAMTEKYVSGIHVDPDGSIDDIPYIDPPQPGPYKPSIRVEYTPTKKDDGTIVVSYAAYDEDDNDITDQFSTITIGDGFLHKEEV